MENNVGVIKNEFKKFYINYFDNIDQVQEFVSQRVDFLNKRKHPRKNDTCNNLLNHEKGLFLLKPKKLYVYYHERYSKVFNNGMIRLNNNYYSVSEMFKGEKVLVRLFLLIFLCFFVIMVIKIQRYMVFFYILHIL